MTGLADARVIAQRMKSRGLRPRLMSPGVIADVLRPDRRDRVTEQIRDVRDARDNTDLWPVSTAFALMHWGSMEGGAWSRVLGRAMRVRPQDVWGVAMGLAIAVFLAACLSRRPVALAAPATLAAVGWGALILEVTIVFAFQGLYGYAYEQLGMLFAAFMIGLACGGRLGGRSSRRSDPIRMALTQLAMALLAGLMPSLFHLLSAGASAGAVGAVALAFLNLLVGGMTGYQFPMAVRVVVEGRPGVAARGGFVYALDLAGSCLGALLAGALLIPAMGLPNTCYSVAGVLLVSAACVSAATKVRS